MLQLFNNILFFYFMKLLKNLLIIAVLSTGIFTSCVDDDYDWDKMNTGGVLNIPPVPLGTYEKMTFDDSNLDLDEILDPELDLKLEFQYSYTLKNLFDSDVVTDFFHEYMERDLSISGDLDVAIKQDIRDWGIDLIFTALKEDNTIDRNVVIDTKDIGKITNGKQNISIVFPKSNRGKMDEARHLMVTVKFKVPRQIELTNEDYIQLSNLVIKSAGYFVDL